MSALGFYDAHRQPHWGGHMYADFLIGTYGNGRGGVDEGGEFVVKLIELDGDLCPHLEVYGDGVGSLRRAIDAGLLAQLDDVADHIEFSHRLLSLGFVDLSTEPLPERDRSMP